jgi:hypothetical protein
VVGQPVDQVRLILIFLAQYPLGWFFFYFIRGTYFRHAFNILVGFAIQLYCYKEAVVHVWLLTGVAYLLMNVLPRKSQANYVMLWVLVHLSLSHVHRMWTNFGGFDLEISTFNML